MGRSAMVDAGVEFQGSTERLGILLVHALSQEVLESVSLVPQAVLIELLASFWVGRGSYADLEVIGQVTLGGDVGEQMRQIAKLRHLGTDGTVKRDRSKR